MEEMTIVYFVLGREITAKKKRREDWQYFVQEKRVQTPGGMLYLFLVQIPRFQYKNKNWKESALAEYLDGLALPIEGRNVLYLFDKQMQEFFCRENETLTEEWLLFLLKYYSPTFDNLIILASRELEPEKIIWQYARMTRYIGVAVKEPENYLELSETLSEEYGFLLDLAEEFKQLRPQHKGKWLIVAGDEPEGITPAWLSGDCIWLSAKPNNVAKQLCARAKGVQYLDIEIFLKEVLHKNA